MSQTCMVSVRQTQILTDTDLVVYIYPTLVMVIAVYLVDHHALILHFLFKLVDFLYWKLSV